MKRDARGLPCPGRTRQNVGNAPNLTSRIRSMWVEKDSRSWKAYVEIASINETGKGDASMQLPNMPSRHGMRTSALPARLVSCHGHLMMFKKPVSCRQYAAV